jgi:hypothetical protein
MVNIQRFIHVHPCTTITAVVPIIRDDDKQLILINLFRSHRHINRLKPALTLPVMLNSVYAVHTPCARRAVLLHFFVEALLHCDVAALLR